MAPSGQEFMCGTVVRRIHNECIFGETQFIDDIENRAHVLIVVDHRIVIRRLPSAGLTHTLWLGIRADVHVGEVDPAEERLAGLVLTFNEIHCCIRDVVINRFHAYCSNGF
jgi:hypothetical protein